LTRVNFSVLYHIDIKTQGVHMDIDNFVNSCLKITAKENLFIENDLNSTQSKTIQELINEKENSTEEKDKTQQETK
jgi:hypothetical protein